MTAESGGIRAVPSLKLRLVGLFCLVAGVLAIVGATTGWDTKGTPAAAFWVVGIALLLISVPLLLTRGPKVASAGADAAGIAIELRNGTHVQLPWTEIATVALRGLGPPPHTTGWVLDLTAAGAGLAEHGVGRFARPRNNGAGHLIVPLPSHAGHALEAHLRQFAGPRYAPGG